MSAGPCLQAPPHDHSNKDTHIIKLQSDVGRLESKTDELRAEISSLKVSVINNNSSVVDINDVALSKLTNLLKNSNCDTIVDQTVIPNVESNCSIREMLSEGTTNLVSSVKQTKQSVTTKPIDEILITNISRDPKCDIEKSAFAVLEYVLPAIAKEDIVSCRIANRKDDKACNKRPSPLFIKCRSPDLVTKIISAKQRINLFCTRDLNLSSFNDEERSSIFGGYIYIAFLNVCS